MVVTVSMGVPTVEARCKVCRRLESTYISPGRGYMHVIEPLDDSLLPAPPAVRDVVWGGGTNAKMTVSMFRGMTVAVQKGGPD
jgi:hypothetical protein